MPSDGTSCTQAYLLPEAPAMMQTHNCCSNLSLREDLNICPEQSRHHARACSSLPNLKDMAMILYHHRYCSRGGSRSLQRRQRRLPCRDSRRQGGAPGTVQEAARGGPLPQSGCFAMLQLPCSRHWRSTQSMLYSPLPMTPAQRTTPAPPL